MRIIERVPEHYDVQEVQFGRVYGWHPESVVVECRCGKRMTLKRSDIIDSPPDCVCGVEHTSILHEELILQLLDEDYEAIHHPWRYWRTSEDAGIPL